MEVAKRSLFEKLKINTYRKLVFWLMDTSLYSNILKHIMPFIRLSLYYPKFRKFMFGKLYYALQPGDILFSIDYNKLTTKFIGGEWSHVGICVGKGRGKVEVVEMTHHDFHETDFFQFCKESERVAIGRIDDPRWSIDEFIKNVWAEKGSKYNDTFRAKEKHDPRKHGPTNKNGGKIHKFNYCSQLPMAADRENIIDANWEDLAGLGVPYISPTGLFHAKNMKLIADSGKPKGK